MHISNFLSRISCACLLLFLCVWLYQRSEFWISIFRTQTSLNRLSNDQNVHLQQSNVVTSTRSIPLLVDCLSWEYHQQLIYRLSCFLWVLLSIIPHFLIYFILWDIRYILHSFQCNYQFYIRPSSIEKNV